LTDLYQVGAVVYTMLTGEAPYTGSHTQIMHDVVLGDGPTPPSRHRSELSEAIDVAVTQAIAKQKYNRYRGLQDFERVLRAIRTNEPLPMVVASQIESPDIESHPVSTTKRDSLGFSTSGQQQEATDVQVRTDPWPMLHGNTSRTGYHSSSSAPDSPLIKKWQFETGNISNTSPVVVDGTVFVGNDDDNLCAVNASTGEELWHFKLGGKINSSPAVAGGTVFVKSDDDNLYAVDPTTGEEVWQHEIKSLIWESPAVVDGTVFIGSGDHNLYAVDASTGADLWHFETGDEIFSSPAVADGTVFVLSRDGNLYAISEERTKIRQ